MRGTIYKALTKICSLFGSIGSKLQSWVEFKEWEYWNDEQWKIIDLPEDVKVFLRYNRKGEFLRISVSYWPLVDGVYNRGTTDVLRTEFTKEEIHQLATKEESK